MVNRFPPVLLLSVAGLVAGAACAEDLSGDSRALAANGTVSDFTIEGFCTSRILCPHNPAGILAGDAALTRTLAYPSNLWVTEQSDEPRVSQLGAFSSFAAPFSMSAATQQVGWDLARAPAFYSENDSFIYRLSQLEDLPVMTFWESSDAALTLGITRQGLAGISLGPKSDTKQKPQRDSPNGSPADPFPP